MCQELLGSCWRSWLSSQRGQDTCAGVEGDLLTFILNWEWGRGCSTLLVTSAQGSSLYSVICREIKAFQQCQEEGKALLQDVSLWDHRG